MDAIQTIYIALFGRPADPLGLQYYMDETDNGQNLDAIGDLTASAEYQTRFEGQSNQQVIIALYNSLFNRNPDAAGLAYYLAEWQSGRSTLESIAIDIATGAEGADVDVLAAKVDAANDFSAAVAADADLLAAYQGDEAAAVARNYLAPITDENPATEAGLEVVLGDLVDAGNVGETFTLTDRIDAPGINEDQPGSGRDTTGTDNNDRFIANDETLQAGDRVDGREGYDTFELAVNTGGGFGTAIQSENVERIEVRSQDSFVTADLSDASGVEVVATEGTGGFFSGVTFTEVQNSVDLEIENVRGGVAGLLYDRDVLGEETAQDVSVEDSFVILGIETDGDDTITELNLEATGENAVGFFAEDSVLETLNVSGAGAVAIGGDEGSLDGVTSIDASENEGGVLIDLTVTGDGVGSDVTIEGSQADDLIWFGDSFTADDVVDLDGGDFDEVVIGAAQIDELEGATLDGVEVLGLFDEMDGAATIELNDFDFDQVHLYELSGGDVLTLDDADDQTIRVYGDNEIELQFASTDDVVIEVGTASDLAAFDEIGSELEDIFDPLDADAPLDNSSSTVSEFIADLEGQSASITYLDLSNGVETGTVILNGDLTIETLEFGLDLETVTASGEGDLIINLGAGDSTDTSLIDLSGLTGGFDNEGAGAFGEQTWLIGDIGEIDRDPLDALDFDNTTDGESYSLINIGNQLAPGDGARDVVEFTSDFGSNVAIVGFIDTAADDVLTDDLLDFSALGINYADLDIAQGADGATINSDAFGGSILLMGVTASELTQNDFIF